MDAKLGSSARKFPQTLIFSARSGGARPLAQGLAGSGLGRIDRPGREFAYCQLERRAAMKSDTKGSEAKIRACPVR